MIHHEDNPAHATAACSVAPVFTGRLILVYYPHCCLLTHHFLLVIPHVSMFVVRPCFGVIWNTAARNGINKEYEWCKLMGMFCERSKNSCPHG